MKYILVFLRFNYFSLIAVINSNEFSICDTTTDRYGSYLNGGIASKVKMPFTLKFVRYHI